MNVHVPEPARCTFRRWRFNCNDRLTIDDCHYVVTKKKMDIHFLRRVTDGIVENFCIQKSDEEIGRLLGDGRLTVAEGFFSRVMTQLRFRHDNSPLLDLTEAQLRTVLWKEKWVRGLLDLRADLDAEWRPRITNDDIALFVERTKDAIHDWYIERFGESRRPGRKLSGRKRKAFDWPSPSALRKWADLFAKADYRREGLCPLTRLCGNRNQLNPEIVQVIAYHVRRFCSRERPSMQDIIDAVNADLERMNRGRRPEDRLAVGDEAVRRRIRKIAPFIRDLGRDGEDRTLAHYTAVGKGSTALYPMQRIEMDDWEADLFALIKSSPQWKKLSRETRKKVPRIRCNVSAAIDCASKSIVGLSVAAQPPSSATTRATLRSILNDKTPMAEWVGAKSDWPMAGRPEMVASDGGSAFRGDIDDVLRHIAAPRSIPEQDPRKRGTIEAFFRNLKGLLSYFAGRAFSNVVEKGDYPSEELASLTVEEFHRAVIRWIVDKYHHTPHRRLDGLRPYEAWCKLSESGPGVPPPPSEEQMVLAFGLKQSCAIDRYGVWFLNLRYNSEEVGHLHRLIGKRKVFVFVDPEEIGEARILIPLEHRGNSCFGGTSLLRVPCMDPSAKGRTLVDLILRNKAYRAAAKQSEKDGEPFRLAAVANLLEGGERARRDAGLPSGYPSQPVLDKVAKIIGRREQAAFNDVDYVGDAAIPDEATFGTQVARSRKTRVARMSSAAPPPGRASATADMGHPPPGPVPVHDDGASAKPRRSSRSINFFEEDD